MTDAEERSALIEALTQAAKIDENVSLLSRPSPEYSRRVKAAVEASPSFKAVTGKVLYTADSLVPLHSEMFASHMAHKLHVKESVDWLLKVLKTKTADGYLVAAIWGLSVKEPVELSTDARLVPFAQLRDSYMKMRILDRANRYRAHAPWTAPNYFQLPTAAYVCKVQDVQYIGVDAAAIDKINASLDTAKRYWPLLEIFGAGGPSVFGHWFEYSDGSLDIDQIFRVISFHHSEVVPRIRQVTDVATDKP